MQFRVAYLLLSPRNAYYLIMNAHLNDKELCFNLFFKRDCKLFSFPLTSLSLS